MSALNSLILGLGLFFLGLRLVGENLQGLCSGSFRAGIAATASRPVSQALLGALAGGLMQSATAVTFICVSLVQAGLLTASAAGPVIIWSNVGLTILAFVATLNIHPAVAFLVGGSGIVLGIVRIRVWRTAASVLLGIGLILFGLEQMGAGAAPLKDAAWFQSALHSAISSPWTAFAAGILVAAILQSNTGSTMMVIALSGAGAIPFEKAALIIYGTNLGAIALRLLLAGGMSGTSLRLVRLEDAFCAASGVVMLILYFVEAAGIPLVFVLSSLLADTLPTRLAILFLLSNLLPAILISPFLGPLNNLLTRIWPDVEADQAGKPQYLSPRALDDPPTAMDLLRRELARLLSLTTGPSAQSSPSSDPASSDFSKLSMAIESFSAQLASRSSLRPTDAVSLHNLRSVLSGIRHVQDALETFFQRMASKQDAIPPASADPMVHELHASVDSLVRALDKADAKAASSTAGTTRHHSPEIAAIKTKIFPEGSPAAASLGLVALYEDFVIALWSLHHLAKLTGKTVSAAGLTAASAPACSEAPGG